MFRELRRKRQALSQADCAAILERGGHGVLALSGDGGYPYAVPISYVYAEGKCYFHCAKAGHKLDAIARDPRASLCVVDHNENAPERFTTYFRSVVVFGRMRVLEDGGERRTAMERLAEKYAPARSAQDRDAEIDSSWGSLCVLELTAEHISGKEAIELVREREQ